jgi:hypothetical protein
MAVEARCFLMFAEQVVIGCAVVELGFKPFGWLMAACAVSAHLVLMRFVVLVAIDAVGLCFPVFGAGLMAVLTFGFSVRAEQLKVSKAVVESVFIQQHDDRISTFMFCVAGRTLIGLNLGALAVKPGFRVNVESDILMAVEAKLLLSLLVEHLVARGTFAFELEVRGCDFSGHDQRLNILSARGM